MRFIDEWVESESGKEFIFNLSTVSALNEDKIKESLRYFYSALVADSLTGMSQEMGLYESAFKINESSEKLNRGKN